MCHFTHSSFSYGLPPPEGILAIAHQSVREWAHKKGTDKVYTRCNEEHKTNLKWVESKLQQGEGNSVISVRVLRMLSYLIREERLESWREETKGSETQYITQGYGGGGRGGKKKEIGSPNL